MKKSANNIQDISGSMRSHIWIAAVEEAQIHYSLASAYASQ
jgi:hypothetical protein